MNEKCGTTKLLVAPRGSPAAKSVLDRAIAVRLGDRSSGIALVDTSDPGKALIFQITYAEESHRAACLDFLAIGENKDLVQRVFVDRLVPEFRERLPQFADRTHLINYSELLPKSAQLLFDLSDSFENILYQDKEGWKPSSGQLSEICALIASSDTATSITIVDRRLPEHPVTTKSANVQTHGILSDARHKLATLLSVEAAAEKDAVDNQLAFLLHNMALSEKSDAFQSAFASCVQPALETYAALIRAELDLSPSSYGVVLISDAIFSSHFCRRTFARDFLADSNLAGMAVSFVADPGLLGFLGALQST